MSESFGSSTATVTALENAAKAGAVVRVIVLSSDESGNATEAAALTAMKADGIQIRLNPAGGSEKMTLISGAEHGVVRLGQRDRLVDDVGQLHRLGE